MRRKWQDVSNLIEAGLRAFRVAALGFRVEALGFNVGALITTYTILGGVPYYNYSMLGPKTLF